jgi:hypothetical protein
MVHICYYDIECIISVEKVKVWGTFLLNPFVRNRSHHLYEPEFLAR